MIDKITHFFGGFVICFYFIPYIDLENKWIVILPLLSAIMVGIGIEFIEVIFKTGRFDIYDIIATSLGGLLLTMWMVKEQR